MSKNIKASFINAPSKNLSLYVHIPFCQRKCLYCDFLSFPPRAPRESSGIQSAYIGKLCEEIQALAKMPGIQKYYLVDTIFIGGGTPSVLEPSLISQVLRCIHLHYPVKKDAEISIEANPASALRQKFSSYLFDGINRLSIGLQSADNGELRILGRLHRFEDFLKCYQEARMEGFQNINVDLIYAFPGQTVPSFRKSLRSISMLRPEHLSIYSLIVEEGTPFYEMEKAGKLLLPDEESVLAMDHAIREITARCGYERYEISNYARPGYTCRHNEGYWSDVPYLGFGLGASSYFAGKRCKNTEDLDTYLRLDFSGCGKRRASNAADTALPPGLRIWEKPLTRTERMNEFLFLGLRRTKGISEMDFTARFSVDMESVFGEKLNDFVRQGFLLHENYRYRFTEQGMDVSNAILSQLLLDEQAED